MKIAAVIPAYNEAARIAQVVAGCRAHGLDVIAVDDCSADGTADAAAGAGARAISHETNRGKGAALETGKAAARESGYDAVLTLDGDGQHSPDDIPAMLAAAESTDADMVIGTRMGDTSTMPFVRRCTNRFMSWLISKLARTRITDSQSGFRLMKLSLFDEISVDSDRFDAESEIIIKAARAGKKIVEVPIKTIYGDERSRIRPVGDTIRFIGLVLRILRGK